MGTTNLTSNKDIYIIYLRKSRADNPAESVEEVLSKHETMLQDLAKRELGYEIPEKYIYREIVSGETIEERPEMLNVLAMLEDPSVKGVLVVEPQRLSRGDLEDCGKIVNAFRYSGTKVLALNMTYDLSNKMHRKFFEQELMRGNDYLEYTKEILLRGRINAVQNKGAYIGNVAPFGYDKAIIDGVHSLTPNENADAVRLAFHMYVNEGKTVLQIARHLDSIGVKPMNSDVWERCSIRVMLRNVHYAGYVRFGGKKTEKVYVNGQLSKRRGIPVDKEEVIIAKGKHVAIVDQELFDAAQEKIANNPRAKWDAPLKNMFAGVFVCGKCGRAIKQHPYKHARDRFECCNRVNCKSKSVPQDEIIENVIFALETEKLPELETKLKNDDGNALIIQKRQIEKMGAELAELNAQENKQFELLEKGIYTEEIFVKRNRELHAEIEALKTRIFEAKKNLPKSVNYEEKIVSLKKAIAGMRDDSISIEAKNKLIKAIIEKMELRILSYEGRGKVKYELSIFLLL